MMMKTRAGILALAVALLLLAGCAAAAPTTPQTEMPVSPAPSAGRIYLYGEAHGNQAIIDKEFETWNDYYCNEGMRHLFVELPYYTAQFLNLWMQADGDEQLDAVYDEWAGTLSQTPGQKAFYQRIKRECPETVFHGTDVGHQYATTGARYLEYLRENRQEDSEAYRLAQEAVAQGKRFYGDGGDVYRENVMVENFIRAFDALGGEDVMGIYGAAHTGLEALDNSQSIPSMANQLAARYGGAVQSEDLSWLAKAVDPERVDAMEIGGNTYAASYFGEQDLTAFSKRFTSRAFWRLEDAYDDFADRPKTGDCLPYDNYPMAVAEGQVFVIDCTKTDGSVTRLYYRSDGNAHRGKPTTEQFTIE